MLLVGKQIRYVTPQASIGGTKSFVGIMPFQRSCIDSDSCFYMNLFSGYDSIHSEGSFLPIGFASFILMISNYCQ